MLSQQGHAKVSSNSDEMLPRIHGQAPNSWKRRYSFDCAGRNRFVRADARKDVVMIEMITVFFGLFSAGIFLAHAFDGYRSRA
jgi:hypothetical protein